MESAVKTGVFGGVFYTFILICTLILLFVSFRKQIHTKRPVYWAILNCVLSITTIYPFPDQGIVLFVLALFIYLRIAAITDSGWAGVNMPDSLKLRQSGSVDYQHPFNLFVIPILSLINETRSSNISIATILLSIEAFVCFFFPCYLWLLGLLMLPHSVGELLHGDLLSLVPILIVLFGLCGIIAIIALLVARGKQRSLLGFSPTRIKTFLLLGMLALMGGYQIIIAGDFSTDTLLIYLPPLVCAMHFTWLSRAILWPK